MSEGNETRCLSLAETAAAAGRIAGKPRLSIPTAWRWCRIGIKSRAGHRIKLDHIRIGGRVMVPAGALEVFFKAVADADSAHFDRPAEPAPIPFVQPHGTRHAKRREHEIQAAETACRARGIL